MWTTAFWRGAAERGIKTFCQTLLAAVGLVTIANFHDITILNDLEFAGIATALSLVTSIGNADFTAGLQKPAQVGQ